MPGRTGGMNENKAERSNTLLLLLSGAVALNTPSLRCARLAVLAGRGQHLRIVVALLVVVGIIAG